MGERLVNANRIASDLEALSALTEPDRPWTRRAFSAMFDQGRAWLTQQFQHAGLATRIDAGGNLLGILPGSENARGTIIIGSHSDTVPDGGRFDGVAGVVAALEIARTFAERKIALKHDLCVVDFLAEEVSIFGVSCIGSRAMAGVLPQRWLEMSTDKRSLAQAIRAVGGAPENIAPRDDLKAFIELHIEQGPVLEAQHYDIGLVTAIAGITRIEIELQGRADHAGTTPMDARADALVCGAYLIAAIARKATELADKERHFTATVGELDVLPNAANVVPSRVRMLIDARAEDQADMHNFVRFVEACCADLPQTEAAAVKADLHVLSDNPPVPMSTALLDRLQMSADNCEARHLRLVSGAGHDAAFMARLCPAAMVFVPCQNGRSHAPEEWAHTRDITLGADIIVSTIRALDNSTGEL